MTTEKLYLKDIQAAYKTTFNGKIIGVEENKITLDRSLFYPIGGGQNWDLGYLEGDNGKVAVTEVRGRDSIEHHVESNHQFSVGDEIIGSIDWERRYSHMKMHTAQHVMSGLAYEIFNGARTVGNQIHATHSRIDFNPISLTEEMLNTLSDRANELTEQSIIVDDGIMTRDEINSIMPPDRTNMNLLPKSVRDLRVVKIGDYVDLCPCAGTHVSNLVEIGSVNIIGKKSKGKGTQRITYELSLSNNILEPDSRII
jgi:misacylated tRNA(Ala) deacylase